MIETRHLKNVVIFIQTILSFVLLKKNRLQSGKLEPKFSAAFWQHSEESNLQSQRKSSQKEKS